MTDLDDRSLRLMESRARFRVLDLLRELFPLRAFPGRDEAGILRLGYGRSIEVRGMSERVAKFALADDVQRTQAILRGRVFELIAVHPEAEAKLDAVYAIGDILGPEQMRDWAALWAAMRRMDWPAVGVELMTCQWDRYLGASAEKKRAVFSLILKIVAPMEPGEKAH